MTRRLSCLILAALALAATPAIVSAQPRADEKKQPPPIPADGTDILLFLLDRAKIQPVKESELVNLRRYDDLIVISLGNPNWAARGQAPLNMASNVVQAGGAALIASDTFVFFQNAFGNAQDFNGQTTILNASVAGARDTQRDSLFLGKPNLPFVVPLARPAKAHGPEWDLFEGLDRIATNKPSCIMAGAAPRFEFRSQLASFPDDCKINGVTDIAQDKHFFAVGGATFNDRGRFLALSDPSVFINEMMIANDPETGRTHNLRFAERVVGFLSEHDGQQRRKRCLFYQNGVIVERFDSLRSLMQPPLPLPNIMAMQEKLTDFANKIVDQFETNDTSNKAIVGEGETDRNRRFKAIMQFILAMLTIRALWYLWKRVWIARRPSADIMAPPGGLPLTSRGERPAGVFDRRQRELLRRNNLYEPVRTLIREMFAEAGAPEDAGKKLPKVIISDVVTRPDTLRDALSDLWKIAYGPPRVVTVQRWNALEPLFERVRQAHAEGKWRFA